MPAILTLRLLAEFGATAFAAGKVLLLCQGEVGRACLRRHLTQLAGDGEGRDFLHHFQHNHCGNYSYFNNDLHKYCT